MIDHLRHEREQLLGRMPVPQPPNAQPAPSVTEPAAPVRSESGEPPASERLKNPLRYVGYTRASEILQNFGVTFADLVADAEKYKKPLADIGASCSTLAFELAVRSARCYPFDPGYNLTNPNLRKALLHTCERLAPFYTQPGAFNLSDAVAPIRSEYWPEYVDAVVRGLLRDMSKSFASRLTFQDGRRVPDRFFSTVISHQSLPKYLSTDAFLGEVLPELLRVADTRVILFPLVTAGPGNELVHSPGTPERERLDRILRAHGFSFHLTQSRVPAEHVAQGELSPGYDLAGHFVRDGR